MVSLKNTGQHVGLQLTRRGERSLHDMAVEKSTQSAHSRQLKRREETYIRTSMCPLTARRPSFNSLTLVFIDPLIGSLIILWLVGATVARLTPDQKVARSNRARVKHFAFLLLVLQRASLSRSYRSIFE